MKSVEIQPSQFKAIAAMSLNRVIGNQNKIPWHIPEDFRWFKQVTTGHFLLMGRKTYESIGRPLPGRTTLVLSRTQPEIQGVTVIASLSEISLPDGKNLFLCGGSEIYRQFLPLCGELLLTLVQRTVDGDAFFPDFERQFELAETVRTETDFSILRYRNRNFH